MKIAGTAGGTWVLAEARMRDVPMRCDACGRFVMSAWRYFLGAVSHATICTDCAPQPKEEGNAATGGSTASS